MVCGCSQVVEHMPLNPEIVGSILLDGALFTSFFVVSLHQ